MDDSRSEVSLGRVALEFLRMGAIGYGGPIALIALMEKECCGRLKWLNQREFAEIYVYCKLLPGPVAYQVALSIGYQVRGRVGGLIAGLCFLLPAFLLILGLSVGYSTIRNLPQSERLLEGMRAGALVVMVDSCWRLFKPYQNSRRAWIFIAIAFAMMLLLPRWEPLIIISGGLAMVIAARMQRTWASPRSIAPVGLLLSLFWVHFKSAFLVFGTGLAVIPVLEREVVHHFHWLTSQEFLDGIAFGQITPGPVTITSVFIGYKVASFAGAVSALAGMYTPGIILVLGVLPMVRKRLEGKLWLGEFQSGAVPMVIGCIIAATLLLGQASLTNTFSWAVFLILGIAAMLTTPGWLLIPLGSLLGVALSRVGIF